MPEDKQFKLTVNFEPIDPLQKIEGLTSEQNDEVLEKMKALVQEHNELSYPPPKGKPKDPTTTFTLDYEAQNVSRGYRSIENVLSYAVDPLVDRIVVVRKPSSIGDRKEIIFLNFRSIIGMWTDRMPDEWEYTLSLMEPGKTMDYE